MRTLKALIEFLAIDLVKLEPTLANKLDLEFECQNLFTDSRDVQKNSVFIALQGTQAHGVTYAEKAIELGAVCILTNHQPPTNLLSSSIAILVIDDLEERLSSLANWFYHRPSHQLKVIGITGTNGKTSTSHYVAQILSQTASVGVLGTLGNGLLGQLLPSSNTTLETVSLNRKLNEFVQIGVEYVVMEVSSHAIALDRIKNIRFEGVALTQVTRDHLDFHRTEKHYQQTKARLFLEAIARFKVLNLDDNIGWSLINTLAEKDYSELIGYSLNNEPCLKLQQNSVTQKVSCLAFEAVEFSPLGITGNVTLSKQREIEAEERNVNQYQAFQINTPLMGEFNAENLLCALSVCVGCGLTLEQIQQGLSELKAISGRMERVSESPVVLIDYAHTPDALEAVLKAVKKHLNHAQSQLWVVFGCGGDRDTGKRPLMGKVAERLADQIIITDDNPRNEEPEQITLQIRQGMKADAVVDIVHDRAQAIEYAMRHAKPEDVVVIAGKGHENYQEIKGQRFFMSDAVLVDLTLREIAQEKTQ